ncbi:hypothetical protein HOK51_03840 [Candidatus Woesearchaeota archaeon]|jgi:hypothetical protein|nr:hypothetical protein [Candidatus Woesearchaeota archaeon]MBT6518954.1 hypothetical protein [Candidatus Woesearchaeota archaeon]MBT7368319.1 hypothetical protein [Candidatus Woesearchaeota archaeon]
MTDDELTREEEELSRKLELVRDYLFANLDEFSRRRFKKEMVEWNSLSSKLSDEEASQAFMTIFGRYSLQQIEQKENSPAEVYNMVISKYRDLGKPFENFPTLVEKCEQYHPDNAKLYLNIGKIYAQEAMEKKENQEYSEATNLADKALDYLQKTFALEPNCEGQKLSDFENLIGRLHRR